MYIIEYHASLVIVFSLKTQKLIRFVTQVKLKIDNSTFEL